MPSDYTKNCLDCGRPIKVGPRCRGCSKTFNARAARTYVCENCGATFYRCPSEGGRFCCRACYVAFHQAPAKPQRKRRTIEERFWSNVSIGGSGDCWEWQASGPANRYGLFWVSGRNIGAHRFSWSLANGAIPDGMFVLHECDNPRCVNPAHLFLGTHEDNMRDKARKGRQFRPIGGLNGMAKSRRHS